MREFVADIYTFMREFIKSSYTFMRDFTEFGQDARPIHGGADTAHDSGVHPWCASYV